MRTPLLCAALLGACVDSPDVSQIASAVTVGGIGSSGCSTAVVLGLATQISDEISCEDPTSLVPFSQTNGITFTSNAVLPYLAQNAKDDLMAVGNVQVNSAFRTIAQQYLLVHWFNQGRCGITAAAAVGRSNHESGRAIDLANYSSRISAMANQGWAHDVAGDPVHFDHLSSADIRGKDTLAFQKLWNRNNPGDQIAEDGAYGPQTEARLKASPSTGFPIGASCVTQHVNPATLVAIDGPDKLAPGATAHYAVTIQNTTATDWADTAQLNVTGGTASELYDPATWVSDHEVGALGVAIPAGGQGTIDIALRAPQMTAETPVTVQLTLTDGTTTLGDMSLAVTVTPNGDADTSADSGDTTDGTVSGGCNAGGGAGWLACAPLLLVLRRRRR